MEVLDTIIGTASVLKFFEETDFRYCQWMKGIKVNLIVDDIYI
jgi:hypothetical protein